LMMMKVTYPDSRLPGDSMKPEVQLFGQRRAVQRTLVD